MCYFCFLALLSQVGVFMFVFGFLFFVLPEERYFFLFLWHSPKLIRSWVKCWKPLNFHFCCVSSLFSKPVMVWAQIVGFWERPPPSPFPCSTIGPWGHAAHLPFWKVFQNEALPIVAPLPPTEGPVWHSALWKKELHSICFMGFLPEPGMTFPIVSTVSSTPNVVTRAHVL